MDIYITEKGQKPTKMHKMEALEDETLKSHTSVFTHLVVYLVSLRRSHRCGYKPKSKSQTDEFVSLIGLLSADIMKEISDLLSARVVTRREP